MKQDLRTVPRYFLMPPIAATADGSPARVVDMGVRGARVEIRHAMQPGAAIRIVINSMEVMGTVLWCQVDALNFCADYDGYLAGVSFTNPVPGIEELLGELSSRGAAVRIEEMRSHDRYRITAPLTGSLGQI